LKLLSNVCVGNQFRARADNESGCHEDSNVGAEGERGFRRPRYEETEDYMPTSTYLLKCVRVCRRNNPLDSTSHSNQ
jgi:hypothetical protein